MTADSLRRTRQILLRGAALVIGVVGLPSFIPAAAPGQGVRPLRLSALGEKDRPAVIADCFSGPPEV